MAVDTSGMHWYVKELVTDPISGEPVRDAVGSARLTAGGDPLQTYTAGGEPMLNLHTDGYGVSEGFFADTGGADVFRDFNSQLLPAFSQTNFKYASKYPELDAKVDQAVADAVAAARSEAKAAVVDTSGIAASLDARYVDPATGKFLATMLPDNIVSGAVADTTDYTSILNAMRAQAAAGGVV